MAWTPALRLALDPPKHRVKLWRMETAQIVALLVAERDRFNNVIEVLQGPTRVSGRWPKSSVTAATPAPPAPAKKKRRKFSKAQREAAAERMRQRWAAKKKAEAKGTKKSVNKAKRTAKAA